jgi:protein PhnA
LAWEDFGMAVDVLARAGGACELCGASEGLEAVAVAPFDDAEHSVGICGGCAEQVDGAVALDGHHWRCLESAAWSETPAVQVLAWRLLGRLAAEHAWAGELREQIWLDDELRAWAEDEPAEPAEPAPGAGPVDANGTPLASGDSVTIIKSLDVKGAGFVAKRGTLVRNIRVIDDPTHIEGRVNNVSIFLKTCFLKKTA